MKVQWKRHGGTGIDGHHAGGSVDVEGLDLYGRADHLQREPQLPTASEKLQMGLRALYLLLVFTPFILLGPLLLYVSSFSQSKSAAPKLAPNGALESTTAAQHAAVEAEDADDKAPEQYGEGAPAEDALPDRRAAGAVTLPQRMRVAAWTLLLAGIKASGAAFIKWGQWSATREDMFPKEFCEVLAELHDRAPEHSWRASKQEIEAVFGKTVEELFDTIDHKPLASGSIAQVHKAILQVNGQPRSVVVKVRHPMVAERLSQDFRILIRLASALQGIPALKGLSLKASLEQFSATMTAQTDLRVESAHLRRFFRNFVAVRESVTPPFPLPGFETASVLVETFEPGHSVARFIANPAPCNTQIVALGVDAYLKMLLHDNFVHTDLHPGNILVRERSSGNASVTDAGRVPHDKRPLQLVLLDFGLAEELNPTVRYHFISLLHMIGKGDGHRAAFHMLHMGRPQECPDPAAFTDAMGTLFGRIANIHAAKGIDLDQVMKAILQLAREHEVTIDSSYAALVVGVCVIVGFATSLDPRLNLMDAALPAFLLHNLTGSIIGRLYS
ncbi:hypothetical protein WJX73_003175 [Symbiochloris irregularis]|uniref:Protein kinase domain-containing protein n=1 Tax=Symbiochloris irregularis TaxID=706552 RepID=A0AAW1PS86_9CHLO